MRGNAVATGAAVETVVRLAIVNVRPTELAIKARCTFARKPIHPVDTRGAIFARVACALEHVGLTVRAGEAGATGARVAGKAIVAVAAIQARIRATFKHFKRARDAGVAGHAGTRIFVDTISARTAVGTWRRGAFVDVRLTLGARVTRRARAGERCHTIDTGGPVLAIVCRALVYVGLTSRASEAGGTLADIRGNAINTLTSVLAGRVRTNAIVNVLLARGACESQRALAREVVDIIHACSAVRTGCTGALINIRLACHARVADHTVARKPVNAVNTDTIMSTRRRGAFVNVGIAENASVARGALALERIDQIDAGAAMRAHNACAIVLLVAHHGAQRAGPLSNAGTGKLIHAIGALAAILARVGRAIIDVDITQRPCPAGLARACVSIVAIHTRRTIFALVVGTVIDAMRALAACPARGTGTCVGIMTIHARAAVLAKRRIAIVHVLVAQLAVPSSRAHALEGVDAIDAGSTVRTQTVIAIVNVGSAFGALESGRAYALETADGVDAEKSAIAVVDADITLIDVRVAVDTGPACSANTRVCRGNVGSGVINVDCWRLRNARGAINTRVRVAAIHGVLALLPAGARQTAASVRGEAIDARAVVFARLGGALVTVIRTRWASPVTGTYARKLIVAINA